MGKLTDLGHGIPHAGFAALYHLRWGIEEAYTLRKCRGELENFTGRTVHALYQDLYAKLLTLNLAALCAFAAEESATGATDRRKYSYRINRARTLSKVKYHLVRAVLQVQDRLADLIRWIAEDVEAVRPGRAFQRSRTRKQGFHPAYKRTA